MFGFGNWMDKLERAITKVRTSSGKKHHFWLGPMAGKGATWKQELNFRIRILRRPFLIIFYDRTMSLTEE
jgi:hypothetical protein